MNRKTPVQIIYEQIISRYNAQKDRWLSGMTNNYFQWEDFKDKFEDIFSKEINNE